MRASMIDATCRPLAFDATEEDLIAEELRAVIPGCRVQEVRQIGRGRWVADIIKLGKSTAEIECIRTEAVDDTYLAVKVLGYPPLDE